MTALDELELFYRYLINFGPRMGPAGILDTSESVSVISSMRSHRTFVTSCTGPWSARARPDVRVRVTVTVTVCGRPACHSHCHGMAAVAPEVAFDSVTAATAAAGEFKFKLQQVQDLQPEWTRPGRGL